MRRLFLLLIVALLGGLGYGVYLSYQAQDLTDLEGWHPVDRALNPPDIIGTIELAAKTRTDVTITEREINSWLAQNLKIRQEGKFADHVKMKGIWVRFSEDPMSHVEVIIEREVKDQPHTTSIFVRTERKKKEDDTFTTYIYKDRGSFLGLLPIGGRIGQALVPQGFLYFSDDSFRALTQLFEQEFRWIELDITSRAGGRIIFEEDQMRITFPKVSPQTRRSLND